MKDFGLREEVSGQLFHPLPREPVFLTAAPQRAQPNTPDMVTEGAECREIGRHGMIDEVAPNDLRQPEPLIGDRLVHPPSQLLLDLREFCPHSVTPGLPLKQELTLARASADENEPEEFEGFRFSEPALRSSTAAWRPNSSRRVLSGWSDSENSSNRLRIASQKRRASDLVLKADDDIVSITSR